MALEATKPYYQVSSSHKGFIYTLIQNNVPLPNPLWCCLTPALEGWPSCSAEVSASSFLAQQWLKGTSGIVLALSRILREFGLRLPCSPLSQVPY